MRRSDRTGIYLLLLPSLVPIVALSVFPLLRGMYLGFTDARAGRNVEVNFTGLANYQELLKDELFWGSFRVGLLWAFGVTTLQFLLALGLALLLNQPLKGRGLARVLALVPWAMPPVVVGILWRLVYHPDAGLLNEFFYRVGAESLRTNWLGDFTTALPAVIMVGVWAGMPQTTVVLLAGLQGVPKELHEAAATRLQVLWRVVFPLLAPGVVATALFAFISAWNEFFFALVLLKNPDLATLPVTLARFVGIEGTARLGPLAATEILARDGARFARRAEAFRGLQTFRGLQA